jgi:ubiquinone/menaquinone biosynthesis C-methylase UbiE
MDPRLQRRVQRYGWDKAAEFYEQSWARQIEPAQSRMLALAELARGERVLDVACGTGLVTFRAAEQVGADGAVVGTDISDAMVQHVRALAVAHGAAHVTAERMEAEALQLPDTSFDAVLCALGLMFVTDPVETLREIRRVLRPGGRAAFAVWGARKNCGWAELFPIVERRVTSEVCPLFFQMGTGESLALAMREAGFTDIRTERLSATLEYDSAEEALGAAFMGGAVALAYARFDAPTRESAHDEYLASIAPYRRGDGYAIPAEFVVARAMKAEAGD